MLVNLIRNAVKFTVGGMIRILVAYDRAESLIRVHVQDNGLGISKEDQVKIFAMDTTVESSRGVNRDGLGMGLFICQKIVAQF